MSLRYCIAVSKLSDRLLSTSVSLEDLRVHASLHKLTSHWTTGHCI